MHPARVETVDLETLTHTLDHGEGRPPVSYPLSWAAPTPHGLHLGRAFVGHPDILFMERHVLPDLGLLVNHFTGPSWGDGHRYYVDVAEITSGPGQWITRDLYLDVLVASDNAASVLDTDEYLAAVQEGLLGPAQAAQALTDLHRAVNGILSCGTLDAWLGRQGVTLDWRGPR